MGEQLEWGDCRRVTGAFSEKASEGQKIVIVKRGIAGNR